MLKSIRDYFNQFSNRVSKTNILESKSILQAIFILKSYKTLEHKKRSDNELNDILFRIFSNAGINYPERAIADIIRYYKENPPVTSNDFPYNKFNKPYIQNADYNLLKFITAILNNEDFSIEEKLNLSILIEFCRVAYVSENSLYRFENLFENIPDNFHIPLCAARIWASMKYKNLAVTLKLVGELLEKGAKISETINNEFELLLKFIFEHYDVKDFSDDFYSGLINYNKISQDTSGRSFDSDLGTFFGNQLFTLEHRRSYRPMWNTKNNTLFKDIEWSDNNTLTFANLVTKMKLFMFLDSNVLKNLISKLANTKNDEVVKVISNYYEKQTRKNEELTLGVRNYFRKSHQSISIFNKLNSGFRCVGIPRNHSPYHGLHPDQVRPFFTLISQVANVDIIKFHKVDKIYHVRFRVNENLYDLNTGDGFSFDFINSFNEVLLKEKVPYQLVVLTQNTHASNINRVGYGNSVTIFNEEEYVKLKDEIKSDNIAGWAPPSAKMEYFISHISELKKIAAKPNLDKIDITSDPKFFTLKTEIDKLEPIEAWAKLLEHLMKCPLNSKPGKKWLSESQQLVDEVGTENFIKGALSLHSGMLKGNEWFQDDEKLCGMRGLCHILRFSPHKDSLFILKNIIERSYRKVPGGPLNAKLGNIGMESLAKIGTIEAYGVLGTMLAKTKYSVFQRAIKSRMKKFTALLKEYSADDLEDIVVPDFGIHNNVKSVPLGDYNAVISIKPDGISCVWEKDGKTTKSPPKTIKDNFPLELKSVKADVKSIKEEFLAQSKRLEGTYFGERIWSKENWETYILNHNLMSILANRLVWNKVADPSKSFTIQKDKLIDSNGENIVLKEGDEIQLWHPAIASLNNVLAWRDYFFDNQIKQPFKQAFREVYLLTPAEELTDDHSNRFNGHYLRGNTLYSLGKTRQWKMSYEDAPWFKFPNRHMIATLHITSGRILYDNCVTGAISFQESETEVKRFGWYGVPKKSLKDVPPILLSEIMRDVDLFVAISGLAYDPMFNVNGSQDLMGYWQEAAFGKRSNTPLSEIRKDLLQRLLPKTKVKKAFGFDGNFLTIQGKKNSYKINLGSSNIQIQPQDKYLCIVPGTSTKNLAKRIWLPFDGGDVTLMTIISKAFLLFDDDKITDPSIVRQL